MTNLNEMYSGKDHTHQGALNAMDDAVSNDAITANAPSVETWRRTWERGAQPGQNAGKRANYVVGPNGNVVTIADLPSPSTTRWVIRRKAEVVLAVHAGMLTLDEACKRYRLTQEEFFSWQSAIERHGLLALRTTQLRQYRHGEGEPGTATPWKAPRPTDADRFVFTADDVS